MTDRVIVCIGTKKGLFVAESDATKQSFRLRGPFGSGAEVYSTLIDVRTSVPTIFASNCCPFYGMNVLRSKDYGHTFEETSAAPAFPKDDGRSLINIWALEPGINDNELFCGVEPASLFRSRDAGDSWQLVEGLSRHAHAKDWQPGKGGMCAHTIVRSGDRLHVAISAGGHYISDDGGETFVAANQGVGAGFLPDPNPEFGQCVHKIAHHPAAPDRLYMQNHGGWEERPGIGVLRSDDNGDSWYSVADGLPSDFGFPVVVHPNDVDTVYVIPLEPQTRTCPAARPAVWRSREGGKNWQPLTNGLPTQDSFFTILRDAMGFDGGEEPSLYFGTTTGQLWLGRDGGESWECMFDSLPPINCVKAAVV